MRNVVNGFSDVIGSANLAVNGGFRINQRGLFESFTPLKQYDYIADCWYMDTLDLDYCECERNSSAANGLVRFRGYAKAGQEVQVSSRDLSQLPEKLDPASPNYWAALTASVWGRVTSNSASVKLQAIPRYYHTQYSELYSPATIIKPGETKRAVRVVSTYPGVANRRASFNFYPQADGWFDITIGQFVEQAGAYRNPPDYMPVAFSDDLVRCERNYQVGSFKGDVYVPFRTKMANTPSVSVSSGSAGDISVYGFVVTGSTGVYAWAAEAS